MSSSMDKVFYQKCLEPPLATENIEKWPSDDSEDEDYDLESNIGTGSQSQTDEDAIHDDASSSSSFFWSSDEVSSPINILNGEFLLKSRRQDLDGSIVNINSIDAYDCDIMSQQRQQKDVDYKKLVTIDCFFDDHDTAPSPLKKTYPDVLFLSSRSLA
ncbi:hypothetical protein ACLOJK_040746 [Asimina triloba]